jgi:uncharacterized membrane protein
MEEKKVKNNSIYIIIHVIALVLIVLCEIASYTIFSTPNNLRLLFRVISRGIIGLICIYNAFYLLCTTKLSFLCLKSNSKRRHMYGIILGVVGLIALVTAFLGYGTNGDPRLIWWK